MENIIKKIDDLALISNYITLYKNFDPYIVLKHMGKITGEIDKNYIEFLKITNGASILDYCFFGFKNNALGANLYDNQLELWQQDNYLVLEFWACIGDSIGNAFGYVKKKNKSGDHYFCYYSIYKPGKIYLVASSFIIFINKFINQIEKLLKENPKAIGLKNNEWFLNKEFLIDGDIEMADFLKDSTTTEYKKI